jgi:excisionase family DNA binding protein
MALTAEQAAKRLGRTERTIRHWIADGKLTAFHPTHGNKKKYLVEESEVERLAQELAQYEQPAATEQGTATVSEVIETRLKLAEHWLGDLQRWHSELESRIEAIEHLVSSRAGTDGEALPEPLQRATEPTKKTRTPKAAEPPVQGAIQYFDFARKHSVNRISFRDHIVEGSKRTGERVEVIVTDKANEPGKHEMWLSPEQQRAAIAFWQRHNFKFTPCSECPHEQDQEESNKE